MVGGTRPKTLLRSVFEHYLTSPSDVSRPCRCQVDRAGPQLLSCLTAPQTVMHSCPDVKSCAETQNQQLWLHSGCCSGSWWRFGQPSRQRSCHTHARLLCNPRGGWAGARASQRRLLSAATVCTKSQHDALTQAACTSAKHRCNLLAYVHLLQRWPTVSSAAASHLRSATHATVR